LEWFLKLSEFGKSLPSTGTLFSSQNDTDGANLTFRESLESFLQTWRSSESK